MHETANFHQQGFLGAALSGVFFRKDGPPGPEHQVLHLPDLLKEQSMTEANERFKRIDAKLKLTGDILEKMDARDRISWNLAQAMPLEAERFEPIDTKLKLLSELLDQLATHLGKPGSATELAEVR